MITTPISIRLTPENRAWLDKRVDRDDRSINYLINKVLASVRAAEALRDVRVRAGASVGNDAFSVTVAARSGGKTARALRDARARAK